MTEDEYTVTLHTKFSVAPNGYRTHHYKPGDVLTGLEARLAVEEGKADPPVPAHLPEEVKVEKPEEVKDSKKVSAPRSGSKAKSKTSKGRPPGDRRLKGN